jgi:hypothetical protein
MGYGAAEAEECWVARPWTMSVIGGAVMCWTGGGLHRRVANVGGAGR